MSLALFIVLGAGLVLAWLAGVLYTAHVLTHPPRRGLGWAVARGLPSTPGELSGEWGMARAFEAWELTVRVRGRGVDLPVWDVRGEAKDGPVLVWLYGWGESRVLALPRLEALAAGASRVLMFDLPGHGEARGPGGCLCTLGVHEPAIVEALLARADVAPGDAVLGGSSLGSGVALTAAARLADLGTPVRAVLLEAPYRLPATPARTVLRARGLPTRGILTPALMLVGWRMRAGHGWRREGGTFDRAEAAQRLAGSPTRVLVLHGSADWVCPPEDGRAIAQRAGGAFREVRGAGHLDLWTEHRESAARTVGDWVGGLDAQPTASGA